MRAKKLPDGNFELEDGRTVSLAEYEKILEAAPVKAAKPLTAVKVSADLFKLSNGTEMTLAEYTEYLESFNAITPPTADPVSKVVGKVKVGGVTREATAEPSASTSSTNKKYEISRGRIVALRDLGTGIKAGTVGAKIENESQLSPEGDCWAGYYCELSGKTSITGDLLLMGHCRLQDTVISGSGICNGLIAEKCKLKGSFDWGVNDKKQGRFVAADFEKGGVDSIPELGDISFEGHFLGRLEPDFARIPQLVKGELIGMDEKGYWLFGEGVKPSRKWAYSLDQGQGIETATFI